MTSSPLSWPPGPALMRADAVYKDASARGASLVPQKTPPPFRCFPGDVDGSRQGYSRTCSYQDKYCLR